MSVRRFQKRAPKLKPLPFTEEQINLRAYKIWQRRGQQGTPEENWQSAIVELKRERSPFWKLRQLILFPFRLLKRFIRFVRLALTAETPSAALDVLKVVISAFGVLATIFAGVGLFLTYQNSQADRQLNNERLVTERFTKAVEQLGSQNVHVRMGAIYSLERIAKDSPKDHWTIMEVLTAYVRDKSPLPKEWQKTTLDKRKPLPDVTTDVQSALTVISRRETKNDPENKKLDLSYCNLNGANLYGANLKYAFLRGTNLAYTNLSRANFSKADLAKVSLLGAKLNSANLSQTLLRSADLRVATLHEADISLTDLIEANLFGATLAGANLSNALLLKADLRTAYLGEANIQYANFVDALLTVTDLRRVKGITADQIKEAKDWKIAKYDDDFRKELGLPVKKP